MQKLTQQQIIKLIGFKLFFNSWCVLNLSALFYQAYHFLCHVGILILILLSPLPEYIPNLLFSFLLYILISLTLFSFFKFFHRYKAPSFKDILRHIEDTNHLKHRPFRSLLDTLPAATSSNISDLSTTYWQYHQARLKKLVPRLTFAAPVTYIAQRDPYALRHLCLTLGIIFFFSSNINLTDRLERGLKPSFLYSPENLIHIDGWVTPPAHTNMGNILLPTISSSSQQQNTTGAITPLSFPAYSKITLQVNNVTEPPTIHVPLLTPLSPITTQTGSQSYQLEFQVTQRGAYELHHKGHKIQEWQFDPIADQTPQIKLTAPLTVTSQLNLRIPLEAKDDFGITQIDLRLNLQQDHTKIDQRPLLQTDGKDTKITNIQFVDLTTHPWAGLPVNLELIVQDAQMQQGYSHIYSMTLPIKHFNHPVAQKVIEIRKSLVANAGKYFHREAQALFNLSQDSQKYQHNHAIFLSLYSIAKRLQAADRLQKKSNLINFLWRLALFIEEGEKSEKSRELLSLQQKLQNALQQGYSPQEIARLLDQYQQAMSEYLNSFLQDIPLPLSHDLAPYADFIQNNDMQENTKDISEIMQTIRDFLEMGMKEEAQQMLSELQDMLQNLQTNPNESLSQQTKEAVALMTRLRDIIDQQEILMQNSFDRSMGRHIKRHKNHSEESYSQDITQQSHLIQDLLNFQHDLEKFTNQQAPFELNKAEKAMIDAINALYAGNNRMAAHAQGQTLSYLQKLLNQSQQMMAQTLNQSGPQILSIGHQGQRTGQDPFGRRSPHSNGVNPEERINLPNEQEMHKAYKLQKYLRHLLNDRSLSASDRNYIQKLLNIF